MKTLVILTGAGMSAESGISTFRDAGGLWEKYRIEEVATPQAWATNPALVHKFYNARRKQLAEAQPNNGHKGLMELEQYFNVQIVTQNVDNLHERAGSSSVLHLHGELMKMRSTGPGQEVFEVKPEKIEFTIHDKCPKGYPLRPHIVWFGEAVPAMEEAIPIAESADIMAIIGTSLNVYPAAGLVNYVRKGTPIFVVDPERPSVYIRNVTYIQEKAGRGVELLKNKLEEIQ